MTCSHTHSGAERHWSHDVRLEQLTGQLELRRMRVPHSPVEQRRGILSSDMQCWEYSDQMHLTMPWWGLKVCTQSEQVFHSAQELVQDFTTISSPRE